MPHASVLLAEVEALLKNGSLHEAERMSRSLVGNNTPPDQLIAALQAMAEAKNDSGDVTGSIATLRIAKSIASQSVESARFSTSLALLSRETQFQSPEDSLSSLAELRQQANSIGTAVALGGLHLVVARLEACRGLCLNGRRHLEIGRRLLSSEPEHTQCSVLLVDSALELYAGNLARASAAARRGLDIARAAGLKASLAGCGANLSSVFIVSGKPDRARDLIQSSLALCSELLMTRFGLLDALASLELLADNVGACEEQLAGCESVRQSHTVPARSWYDLAHQLTRCAYFERLGDWQQIVTTAEQTDPELRRRQYKALRTSLLCARARAFAHLGRHDEAQASLALAVKTCPRGAVDPLIALEASKAVCETVGGQTRAGARHFDRALTACRAIGYRYHERWIEAARSALQPIRVVVDETRPGVDTTDAALLLTDVATVLGAGHSIDLMALRTVSLLENTPLKPRVSVTSRAGCEYQAEPTFTAETAADGTVCLQLRGSDRHVAISVTGQQTLEEMSLLKSVADIVQTAVRRTSDTDHEDDEQNLWPRADLDTGEVHIFRSPRMIELRNIALRLADSTFPILITGETGTGKEIFARLLHDHSRHRRGPFVPFNCSTVSKDLFDSQLFGYRRGAFTGAAESFPGMIRSAEHGTLFLDEIGDMDLSTQPKLLRFIETGEVHALGELRSQKIPVRIVAATNVNVNEAMRNGQFRRDLFYRLGGAQITLPPLRERKDEIPALAALFVKKAAKACGRNGLTLGDDLVAALLLYDWPGNIRELESEVRRVVALAADGDTLTAAHLTPDIAAAWNSRPVRSTSAPTNGVFIALDQPLAQAIAALEQHFIAHALQATAGRVTEAAQLLGISRKGLFLKRRRGLGSGVDT